MLPTTQKTKQGMPPLVWLIAAVIYCVCPLDFDFVPVLGWADDVVVSYLCIKQFNNSKRSESASAEKGDEGAPAKA